MELNELIIDKKKILSWYTEDVLNDEKPSNVFAFAKKHGMEEVEFYAHFGSLNAIESYFFDALFESTLETLYEAQEYHSYSARDKWLSFYFTFFENLKMNRSFVQYSFSKNWISDVKKLRNMRLLFLEFAHQIEVEKMDFKQKDLNKVQDKVMEESAWLHFLGTLKFWLNDDSANFEKTDVFIEKSVNAGFEIMNVNAFKSVADFGKFMFKEFKSAK